MADDPIAFYFDFISPYAYLAWKKIGGIATVAGRRIAPRPVLFAGLLNHHGQKGPAEIPAKRLYTFKNVIRIAHFSGVPVLPLPSHPFNPLLALRAASSDMPEETRIAFIDRLYDLVWGTASVDGARGVTDPKHVAWAAKQVGLDPDAILAAADSQAMKDRVKTTTDEAIARGAFGVPTMFVGDELFWGTDSLPHLEAHLRGEDPASTDRLADLLSMPVGAVRKPR